ncbi:hypothetical protein SAMN05421821_10267 [Mucilaginibacter lappiensis]|uniref:Uncharacterized protein n=1 Tax=Mucilaginibacter lappiensis TaxID=354630 RepID=A0ABR6PG05_9SPHI|nr:hypothetical protein [Mucilaginibacter lappiensis]MBB6108698.1 hypothetical protein [Mucilaginibacter lappiensis]SIQ27357.1 hypothetical protein SAMN05421821_10267 [Mucilaginibacter lappiensis]
MTKIPGLNKFNGQIAIVKREAQVMRETLNKLQDIHERKLIKSKAYRIGKAARQFETQLRQINNIVEAIEKLRPATAKWDIKFGELVLIESED